MRRITFEDIALGWPPALAPHVVPLWHARDGDRQVAVFNERAPRASLATPLVAVSLDGLADLPDVESVVGAGRVVARHPLPHVRELHVTQVDDQTLRHLPNLRLLAVGSEGLDPAAVPALTGLEFLDLRLESASLANLRALGRWPRLRELRIEGRRLKSLEGIGALTALESLTLHRTGVRDVTPLRALPRLVVQTDDGERVLTGVPVTRVATGEWSLFTDVAGAIDDDTNHDVEDRLRAALDPALAARLVFDAEAGAVSVTGDELAVRAAAAQLEAWSRAGPARSANFGAPLNRSSDRS